MGNRIRINCRKVYDNGVYYQDRSEEIINIQQELNNISSEIESIWGGADGHNFLVSFNTHINNLDQIINFLHDNGSLLKKNALNHNGIDNNFAAKMERSDIDEL